MPQGETVPTNSLLRSSSLEGLPALVGPVKVGLKASQESCVGAVEPAPLQRPECKNTRSTLF